MRELLLQPGYIRIEKPLISDDQVLWLAAGGVGLVLLMLIGYTVVWAWWWITRMRD